MDIEQAKSRSTRGGFAVTVALLALGVAAACSSSKQPSAPSVTVGGIVTDSTGAALTGVQVTAGTAMTMTGTNGSYSLRYPIAQSNVVVAFSKTGFLASSKPLAVGAAGSSLRVNAALKAVAAAQPLDATVGGSVAGDHGASLTVGAGAFVDANGQPMSGMVQVALTPLDPSMPGERAAYPGSLVGTGNGAPSLLQTYGVLDVSATQNGQPLQLAPGQTATITIPVAATGTLPPTQDLWAYNMTTGTWDHEGTATLSGAAYTAQISHFSYHNIDGAVVSGQATCVTGRVVDTSGNPVTGANVSPTQGASVDTLITTDSTGHYCTWVIAGDSETITADATAAPYGEGSITVTGGTAIPFPGSYTCTDLACQAAPDIVLSQPPCMTDGDCPTTEDQCCMVGGHGMCLESFACLEAQSPGSGGNGGIPGFDASIPSFDGSAPCLSTGTLTATLPTGTLTFSCMLAGVASSGGMQSFVLIGSDSTDAAELSIEIPSTDNFAGIAAGSSIPFSTDAGLDNATLSLTASVGDGGVLLLQVTSGSLSVGAWSTTVGGNVSVTIPAGTALTGTSYSTDGTSTPLTGTIAGTVMGTVY